MQIKKFYQSRKSQRTITVTLMGGYIPLYGGSVDLSSNDGKLTAPVPLTLNFKVRARAYVLGKLVKPKFYKRIQCSTVLDPKNMNKAISLKKSCTYQWGGKMREIKKQKANRVGLDWICHDQCWPGGRNKSISCHVAFVIF